MNEERFDIFDRDMKPIGTATRAETHARGLWHQTFHCWIWSRNADDVDVLFQLRHRDKETFPGLLDVSCAGHLLAGETPTDGVRELREELGIDVACESLVACGVYAEEDVISDRFIDREFCHVFALEQDRPLASYRLQADEVSGLFRFRLGDLRRLVADGTPLMADGVILQSDGSLTQQSRTIGQADLVPHPLDYYRLLFEALEAQRL